MQVLPSVPTFGEQIGRSLGSGLTKGFSEHILSKQEQKQKLSDIIQENKDIEEATGIRMPKNMTDPELRKQYFTQQLQGNRDLELQNLRGNQQENLENLKGSNAARNQIELQNLKAQQENQKYGKQYERDIALQEHKYGKEKELADQKLKGKQDVFGQIFGGNINKKPNQMNQESFNPIEISDEQIAQASMVDPNLGRSLQHSKDVALRENRAKIEHELQLKKSSPEYQREQEITADQAKADVKYNQELQETSKQHALKAQTLDRLEKLNKKGVTGKPWEKLAERAGLVNVTSQGRREFAADVKNLITDIRSILGGQFSNFEFQTILNAYPSPDFSQEANAAIIRNLKQFQDIKTKEVDFAKDIKKQNNGKLPQDFQAKVNERVQEYANQKIDEIKKNTQEIMRSQYGIPIGNTLLIDPDGELLSVPDDEVDFLLKNGAELP